jgi:hypothetical protein
VPASPNFADNSTLSGLNDKVKAGGARPPPVDPCAPWYPGRRAFEAVEANALANFLHALPGASAFVELRAYGQIVSAPYSYTCKSSTPDAEDQLELALGAARAMGKNHGTAFTVRVSSAYSLL